ncbi:nucleoid occlusion factor SlmA [bacterium BMS3Abin03]|nr:nucleoid occlusion factor SlmA [bacterium BMS3Abin03]
MEKLNTEIRQKQIKKAVLQIISTKGLGKLSTRNLADKVGVTEGALFRHFKSKRDIMLSIIDDVKNDLLEQMKKIADSNLKANVKLLKFLCAHVRYLIKNKGITILLFSEATYMDDKEMKKRLFDILSFQKNYVKKIIKEGIDDGLWNKKINADNVAVLYMGIPITLNIELILNRKEFKQENFCRKMFGLLERVLK